MMNKKRTPFRWKYVGTLPVVTAFLFFSNTFRIKAEPVNEINYIQQDTTNQVDTVSKDQIQIIDYIEVMPQFPGGDTALKKWLSDNIQYPKEYAESSIQGRVVLRFLITPDGSTDDVEVIKSLDSLCDNEAIRVVKAMPKWIPGKQNGNPVYVRYVLPITFKYQKIETVNDVDSVQQIPVILQDKYYSKDSTQIIYIKVEVMPQFPTGDAALMKFLMKNMLYPIEAAKSNIQGRVLVGFIVTPDGSIADVKVEKSVNPILDAEALRVAKKMPKWIPGKQDGNPVYVYCVLPFVFSIRNR